MWHLATGPLLFIAILVLEGGAPLLSQTTCLDNGSPVPKITIHVYNYAQVSRRQWAEAEKATTRVLQAAGMSSEWITCPVSGQDQEVNPVCERRLLPSEFVLNIMPRQSGTSLQYGDTFGYAQVFTNGQFGHYAYLFYNRVEDYARGSLSPGQVLGGVAAHELGHLLLGSTAHTSNGLMSARWDKDDLQRLGWGRLFFDPLESAQLRAKTQARCGEIR